MVKECPITLDNGVVTVVKFGDTFVQLPSVNAQSKTIFVKYENNKYTVVDKGTEVKTDDKEKVECEENQPNKKTTKTKSKGKKLIVDDENA